MNGFNMRQAVFRAEKKHVRMMVSWCFLKSGILRSDAMCPVRVRYVSAVCPHELIVTGVPYQLNNNLHSRTDEVLS